jgi:hypothetical protein
MTEPGATPSHPDKSMNQTTAARPTLDAMRAGAVGADEVIVRVLAVVAAPPGRAE